MTLPTIHLNGTSAGDLLAAADSAAHALDVALARLSDTAPNGRDYYPQGAAVIGTATVEYIARVRALEAVRDDLQTLSAHVSDAIFERGGRS